jgi:hypothetical protein
MLASRVPALGVARMVMLDSTQVRRGVSRARAPHHNAAGQSSASAWLLSGLLRGPGVIACRVKSASEHGAEKRLAPGVGRRQAASVFHRQANMLLVCAIKNK